MKRNQKGLAPVVIVFCVLWSAVGVVALWHVPAWQRAKKAGCTADYQAGDMGCGARILANSTK